MQQFHGPGPVLRPGLHQYLGPTLLPGAVLHPALYCDLNPAHTTYPGMSDQPGLYPGPYSPHKPGHFLGLSWSCTFTQLLNKTFPKHAQPLLCGDRETGWGTL